MNSALCSFVGAAQAGRMDDKVARLCFHGIFNALSYLHSHDIVHRGNAPLSVDDYFVVILHFVTRL